MRDRSPGGGRFDNAYEGFESPPAHFDSPGGGYVDPYAFPMMPPSSNPYSTSHIPGNPYGGYDHAPVSPLSPLPIDFYSYPADAPADLMHERELQQTANLERYKWAKTQEERKKNWEQEKVYQETRKVKKNQRSQKRSMLPQDDPHHPHYAGEGRRHSPSPHAQQHHVQEPHHQPPAKPKVREEQQATYPLAGVHPLGLELKDATARQRAEQVLAALGLNPAREVKVPLPRSESYERKKMEKAQDFLNQKGSSELQQYQRVHEMMKAKEAQEALEKERDAVLERESRAYRRRKKFPPRVLFSMELDNPVRSGAISLLESQLFEQFVLFLIILNSVFLALWDPLDPDDETTWNQVILLTEPIFTGLFAMEMMVKIISLGFWHHKGSYLRDYWNWLDFVVVVMGFVALSPSIQNVSAIRTLRVLRPLRTINRFKGIRMIVNCLLSSIPQLMNVLAMCIFLFVVFGIVALQLWPGGLLGRCQDEVTGEFIELEDVCSIGGSGRSCGEGYVCTEYGNPNYGFTSFDHFPIAVLTIFQIITMEGWSSVMYFAMDGVNPWVWIYFILLLLAGSFFLVNLWLAVLFSNYSEMASRESESKEKGEQGKIIKILKHMWSKGGKSNPGATKLEIAIEHRKYPKPEEKIPECPKYMLTGVCDSGSECPFLHPKRKNNHGFPFRPSMPKCEEYLSWGKCKKKEACPFHHPDMDKTMFKNEKRLAIEARLDRDLRAEEELRSARGVIAKKSATVILYPQRPGESPCAEFLHSGVCTIGRHCPYDHPGAPSVKTNLPPTPREVANKAVSKTCGAACSLCLGIIGGIIGVVPALAATLCGGTCLSLRKLCKAISMSKIFGHIIMLCIVMNTVIMALEHHGMDDDFEEMLEEFNLVFTFIFLSEAVIKITGLGPTEYRSDGWNVFDFILVVLSMVDIIAGDAVKVNAMRAFRLLRIFRLARSWTSLRSLLQTIVNTLPSLSNLTFLLVLFMFIYTLLGMQLFGGNFEFPDGKPRNNFDTFLIAFVTIFMILTTENWNEVMYNGMRATNSTLAAFYFVTLILFGSYIIFNLFLAILIDNASTSSHATFNDIAEVKAMKKRQKRRETEKSLGIKLGDTSDSNDEESVDVKLSKKRSWSQKLTAKALEKANSFKLQRHDSFRTAQYAKQREKEILETGRVPERSPFFHPETGKPLFPTAGAVGPDEVPLICPSPNLSLFMFKEDNFIRQLCSNIVTHRSFEWVILFFIFVSCVTLAIEDPRVEQPPALFALDVVLTTIFTIEMAMKVISQGLLLEDKAYLRDWWGILDFFIVGISIASLSVSDSRVRSVRVLRALRALRPLRFISRFPEMKIVVLSLLGSIPSVLNVLLVCALFWIVFGILGVQFFRGRFYSCNDPSVANRAACIGTWFDPEQGLTVEREWRNSEQNFDHIGNAFLTLFEVSTLEGWPDIMWQGVDATGVDEQPQEGNQQGVVFFFIFFVIVGAFFVVNLFVGVVTDNFMQMKEKLLGFHNLNTYEREWLKTQGMMGFIKPRRSLTPPKHWLRLILWDVVMSKAFELFVTGLICLNVLFMTFEYEGQGQSMTDFSNTSGDVFTYIFLAEALLKMYAMGPQYFQRAWNVFDFIIVFFTILETWNAVSSWGINAQVFRVLRVFRVVRLVKVSKSLRTLVSAIIYSVKSLAQVGSLLLLLFFIFTILSVNLFHGIKHGEFLNRHANFERFDFAFLTLFRMLTGEDWNGIMHDCMIEPPNCDPENDECGGKWVAGFFVFFYLIGSFMLLNLFIAVILENFTTVSGDAQLTEDDLKDFRRIWSEYDTNATGEISVFAFMNFVQDVNTPLGLKELTHTHHRKTVTRLTLLRYLKKLHLTHHNGRVERDGTWESCRVVRFSEALQAMILVVYCDILPYHVLHSRFGKKFPDAFPQIDEDKHTRIVKVMACTWVQSVYRARNVRRRVERNRALHNEEDDGGISSAITGHLRHLLLTEPVGGPTVRAHTNNEVPWWEKFVTKESSDTVHDRLKSWRKKASTKKKRRVAPEAIAIPRDEEEAIGGRMRERTPTTPNTPHLPRTNTEFNDYFEDHLAGLINESVSSPQISRRNR